MADRQEALRLQEKAKTTTLDFIEEMIVQEAIDAGLLEETSEEVSSPAIEEQNKPEESGFALLPCQFLGLFLNWEENRDTLKMLNKTKLLQKLIELAYNPDSQIIVYTKDMAMAAEFMELLDSETLETSIESIQP